MREIIAVLLSVLIGAPGALAGEMHLTARLIAPISTETNRKGDRITAQILEPQEFAGQILQGVITESKNGGSLKGTSVLTFRFNSWEQNGQEIPIRSQLESLTNSKGQVNVDEEGRSIQKTNHLRAAAATTALGALIGGLAGGAQGAAIGAGAGATASLLFIKFAVKGPRIRLDPNSRLVLKVQRTRER